MLPTYWRKLLAIDERRRESTLVSANPKNGQVIDDDLLGAIPAKELIAFYSDQLFVPSLPLDEVARVLRLGIL
jgi:hypothetical protein